MDFTNLKNFLDDMARTRTPGNSVRVTLNGENVFTYSAGFSDLEEKIPMSGEELVYIYSCSKVATVTAGIQLLEKGAFLLTDPLYEYIPEYRLMYVRQEDGNIVKAENPITVGDLFTMTAGFTYDRGLAAFQKARERTSGKMDTVEVIRCLAEEPLAFEPGTHWQYSMCHDVLAALISVISGKKFRDYMKDNIFDPLDMQETYYHGSPEILDRMAQQYAYITPDRETFDPVEAQKNGCGTGGYFRNVGKGNDFILGEEYDSGGAGIITSLADYSKFLTALANFGTGANGERILSRAGVNLLRTDQLNETVRKDFNWKSQRGCGYGLGVRTHMDPAKSGLLCNFGEFGWGGAAGATAIVDPDLGLAAFYLQHKLNPEEDYYQPRIRNVVYSCL